MALTSEPLAEPWPPCSMTTETAISGSSKGAKATNTLLSSPVGTWAGTGTVLGHGQHTGFDRIDDRLGGFDRVEDVRGGGNHRLF